MKSSSQRVPLTGTPMKMNPAVSFKHKQAGNPLMASAGRSATTLFVALLTYLSAPMYADTLPEIKLMTPQDTLSPDNDVAGQVTKSDTVRLESPIKTRINENNELTNIVLTTKNIRAFGWGEYEVGGRCLCCDNMLDGDCIIVHNTNRTEKKRIKQIVDGRIDADTSDESTYFGDLAERERSDRVTTLMAEINLVKQQDIFKVIIYNIADKEKKSLFISNCELGYYDQFDRLQWAGKAKFEADDDHVTFEMKNPIFTGNLLIKITGGKNRITEVAIYCKKTKE